MIDARELTTEEIDGVAGGLSLSFASLNPQPIPPGRTAFAGLNRTASPLSIRIPGCPGPIILPPNPC